MKLKIAMVQFSPILGENRTNYNRIVSILNNMKEEADVILFPELSNSGYHFENIEQAEASAEEVDNSLLVEFLIDYAKKKDSAIGIGFCQKENTKRYNSALWITPNGVEHTYRKLHLFNTENKYFTQGKTIAPTFTWKNVRIGLMICYDWTFPEMWQLMAKEEVDVICHICNLVMPHAQEMVKTYAFSNHYYIAQVNRVGAERDLSFTGLSSIISPSAELICKASVQKEEILYGEIDTTISRNKQLNSFNHKSRDARKDIYHLEYSDELNQKRLIHREKRVLRKQIKEEWANITIQDRVEAEKITLSKLKKNSSFQNAQNILMFWSLPDEINTHDFIRNEAKSKNIFLPVMVGDSLHIAPYTTDEELDDKNTFGVYEPSLSNSISLNKMDLIIIPGVAFDSTGARLGRGKGYYDRLLTKFDGTKIGLGLYFQKINKVPVEKHDQQMSFIIV
ncbi:5-formyltetrahydrofolate cyclo-ligase [Halosquirtibacter laminarini]|uniref:5-formyltetrahydrofolate cyclo-ligase n=1 Tax=Halosquirtibacter laminarini TaxID=3374600 RepID=A0AC61NDT6_9BACT|nr:5-formyltetrahydrofolate cyclo-ligase [Prolixibacteraceae bacterium]